MKRKKSKRLMQDCRGFSLIEVLLGISVFMVGMLGVTALNISSLKSNTFSGNLSEATLLAATKIEEFMATDFDLIVDTDGDGTGQDTVLDDGVDDDEVAPGTHDNDKNFGLDDTDLVVGGVSDPADGRDQFVGKQEMFTVYWNVAESEPITVDPPRTKTIRVIVKWFVKDEPRQISMDAVRMKEE